MRASVVLLLLMSLVTAHTVDLYQETRRKAVGPRRIQSKPASTDVLRVRSAKEKRTAVYKAGPLKIAGFSTRSLHGR